MQDRVQFEYYNVYEHYPRTQHIREQHTEYEYSLVDITKKERVLKSQNRPEFIHNVGTSTRTLCNPSAHTSYPFVGIPRRNATPRQDL